MPSLLQDIHQETLEMIEEEPRATAGETFAGGRDIMSLPNEAGSMAIPHVEGLLLKISSAMVSFKHGATSLFTTIKKWEDEKAAKAKAKRKGKETVEQVEEEEDVLDTTTQNVWRGENSATLSFHIWDGLLWQVTDANAPRLCVPRTQIQRRFAIADAATNHASIVICSTGERGHMRPSRLPALTLFSFLPTWHFLFHNWEGFSQGSRRRDDMTTQGYNKEHDTKNDPTMSSLPDHTGSAFLACLLQSTRCPESTLGKEYRDIIPPRSPPTTNATCQRAPGYKAASTWAPQTQSTLLHFQQHYVFSPQWLRSTYPWLLVAIFALYWLDLTGVTIVSVSVGLVTILPLLSGFFPRIELAHHCHTVDSAFSQTTFLAISSGKTEPTVLKKQRMSQSIPTSTASQGHMDTANPSPQRHQAPGRTRRRKQTERPTAERRIITRHEFRVPPNLHE
jgi:hypothetical protein